MNTITSLICAGFISLAFSQNSHSALIINIIESGSDVVATLSGSIDDLTGTTFVATQNSSSASFIRPNDSSVLFNAGGSVTYSIYKFAGVPAAYGTTPLLGASSSTSSDAIFVRNNPLSTMWLSAAYVLGTSMSGTATYSGKTFASLGITPGTYVYSWTGDSVTLNIGAAPSPVPEPGQVAASMLLLVGISSYVWMKRRKAAKPATA